jgi:hypothetical protein
MDSKLLAELEVWEVAVGSLTMELETNAFHNSERCSAKDEKARAIDATIIRNTVFRALFTPPSPIFFFR